MVLKADRTFEDLGLPTGSSDAVNWQVAAIYDHDSGEYHASLSSRTRFPTLHERYSTRFGAARPNPNLKSERATNIEISYSGEAGPAIVQTALFYSKVKDMIHSVPVGDPADDQVQSQNVGDGTYKGFEIAANWQVAHNLDVVANYTWLHRGVSDPVRPDFRPTDTPRHSAFLPLDWHALANLDFDWQATGQAGVVFGVRNLLDRNYELVEGFPEPGRSFYLTTRMTF